MLGTLLGLGVWQLERLKWKQTILAHIENKDPKSFASLEEVITHNSQDSGFRKVKFRGVFHHDLSLRLIPRTWQGLNGAHLYTPMTLASSDHTILVNRGWVPENQDNMNISRPMGEIETLGYLQKPVSPGWFTPENDIDKKAWYYLDLDALQQELNKDLLPFYVISIETPNPKDDPRPLDPLTMLRNNHLGYAITWFLLAFALLVMYIYQMSKIRVSNDN